MVKSLINYTLSLIHHLYYRPGVTLTERGLAQRDLYDTLT